MSDKLRWGIIGPGSIARKFADGLKALDDAEIVAVSSRSQASADRFGDEYDVTYRHVGVDDFVANDEIDAVYVATPHPIHHDNTLACIAAGKSVLCEKPFAINMAETMNMISAAKDKNVFLMEAMWTHFFPAMAKVRELITSGAIGDVRLVQVNFGFRSGWNPEGRLFDLALGGGALLDIGIYNIALARMVYGQAPSRIVSMAHLGETGVDEQNTITLGYPGGAMAILTSAIRTTTDHNAMIWGTDGYIKIPPLFWQPDQLIVKSGKSAEHTLGFMRKGNGYNYEADEVHRCLKAGKLESDIVPHAVTLDNMKVMDAVRKQWGLKYPME